MSANKHEFVGAKGFVLEWGMFGWTILDVEYHRCVRNPSGHFLHYFDPDVAIRVARRLYGKRLSILSGF